MDGLLSDFIVCDRLGWTIQQLYEQPHRLVDQFKIIIDEDNKQQKLEAERQKLEAERNKRR